MSLKTETFLECKEKFMNCAILSIGTELLFGSTIDTNANYLSQQLNVLGFNVLYHFTVGDNPGRLEEAIRYLRDKTDIIITTGGLGPTEDDITRDVVGKVYNKKLMFDEEAMLEIEGYFKKTNRTMANNNKKQAYLPENSIKFNNNCGTAPGFAIEDNGKIVVSMPGPPREMKSMWQNRVCDYLAKFSSEKYFSRTIRFFGIGESLLEQRLMSLIHGQTDPTFATYAKEGQCTLRVTSKDKDYKKAEKRVENAIIKINDLVGEYIYSYKDEELVEVVGGKLKEKRLTISAAESCTAGMFVSQLGSVSGISSCLKQSFVTYSNEVKIGLLGVKKDTIDKFTEVSYETALEMAQGLRRITKSDICISVTGYAGPDGGTVEHPVGTVFIGLVYGDMEKVIKLRINNNGRQTIRIYSVLAMLDLINKSI